MGRVKTAASYKLRYNPKPHYYSSLRQAGCSYMQSISRLAREVVDGTIGRRPRGGGAGAAERGMSTMGKMLEQLQEVPWTLEEEMQAEEELAAAKQPSESKELDQMYSDLRFQRLAPGWLPLLTNRSFFIAPCPPLTKLIKLLPVTPPPLPLPRERLRSAFNPIAFVSAEAIDQRMAREQQDDDDDDDERDS